MQNAPGGTLRPNISDISLDTQDQQVYLNQDPRMLGDSPSSWQVLERIQDVCEEISESGYW